MTKTILFFFIPFLIYLGLYTFIQEQKDLLLVTLLISTIIYWASALIPDYQASLIFLFTCLAFSLSPKELIFSGFSSSAFWLVFAGMLIASAIKKVKLTEHFSSFFIRLKPPSYLSLLIIISIFSLCFAFIMPSGVGRVVLLIPVAIVIAQSFGFKENDKGYIGIVLTFILSTTMPGFTILPANAPNMIMTGLVHEIYNIEILYSEYLIVNFLIFGVLKNIFILTLIYYFFKDTIKKTIQDKKETNAKTKEQKILIFILSIMIIFWMSDFIHGISPSIIAIIGVLFLSYPKIGILDTKDINSLNLTSLIFLAGVISLGSVAGNSEFTKENLSWILNHIEFFDSKLLNYISISSFMSFSGIVLTQATIPALYTPIADQLSTMSGFSIDEIFMMQVAAFSTVFFPYQMAPLIIGVKLAKLKQTDMLKVIFYLAIISIIFLMPLQYFWLYTISQ